MTAERTTIGKQTFGPTVYDLIEAATEKVEWRPIFGDWPAMPGLGIKAAIQQLEIPNVEQAGISTSLVPGHYALYGIEGRYKNGTCRYYVVDRGHDLIPVLVDFTPKEETADA